MLIAGDGHLARALVSQALLANCRVPFSSAVYHLFGNWDEYCRLHPELGHAVALEGPDDGNDVFLFRGVSWNADPGLLREPGRIIFCSDDMAENASSAADLRRYFGNALSAHVCTASEAAPGIRFGAPETLYTRELVMKNALDQRAKDLYRAYCRQNGVTEKAWDALPAFERASNRAEADHLLTKLRLLLPGREVEAADRETCGEAYRRFQEGGEAFRERCLRNEHARWMRFHCLYNWRYGETRDNVRRLHPCLVPFEALSGQDQAKDGNSWEQIGHLSEQEAP